MASDADPSTMFSAASHDQCASIGLDIEQSYREMRLDIAVLGPVSRAILTDVLGDPALAKLRQGRRTHDIHKRRDLWNGIDNNGHYYPWRNRDRHRFLPEAQLPTKKVVPYKPWYLLHPAVVLREPSRRQLEILALLAEGLTYGEAADRLYISNETVKSHLKYVRHSLLAKNSTHAVAIAIRNGYIKPPQKKGRGKECHQTGGK